MSVLVSNDTFIHLTLNKLKMDFFGNMCGHDARTQYYCNVCELVKNKVHV